MQFNEYMRELKFHEKKPLHAQTFSHKKINHEPTERTLLIRHTEAIVMSTFVCRSVYNKRARVVKRLFFIFLL